MKKIILTILLGVTLNTFAQVPPGFKGQVYSDISSNGYEWVNVNGKQHIILPKGEFCAAEVKAAQLAPKEIKAPFYFEHGKIAGFHLDIANSLNYTAVSGNSWAIWWPENKHDDQSVIANLQLCYDSNCEKNNNNDYTKATYYIVCLTNTSPKSNIYITATEPDLLNLGKIQR